MGHFVGVRTSYKDHRLQDVYIFGYCEIYLPCESGQPDLHGFSLDEPTKDDMRFPAVIHCKQLRNNIDTVSNKVSGQ